LKACGFVGKLKKLERITGLDPAALAFTGNSSKRLDKNDANYVDIIHTSSMFGIKISIGHADFWPNAGSTQPMCKKNILKSFICSHTRAPKLYAESILSRNKFKTSLSCNNSYTEWSKGLKCQCLSNNCPRMGHYSKENKVFGNFYLKTNGKFPYSID